MNPRIAIVLLLGFVATLAFVGWMVTSRRRQLEERNGALELEIEMFDDVFTEIWRIANDAKDVDPSAQLILMEFERKTDYKIRRISK